MRLDNEGPFEQARAKECQLAKSILSQYPSFLFYASHMHGR